MTLGVAVAHQYCSPAAPTMCIATFWNTGPAALWTIGDRAASRRSTACHSWQYRLIVGRRTCDTVRRRFSRRRCRDLLRDSLPHRTKLDSLGLLSALTGTAEQLPAVTSLVHSGHRGGLDIGEGHWKLLTFQCCGAERDCRQLETRCVGPVRWHGGSCTIRRRPVQIPEVSCRGAGPCRGDDATPAQAPRLHWQPSASEITRALQAG